MQCTVSSNEKSDGSVNENQQPETECAIQWNYTVIL